MCVQGRAIAVRQQLRVYVDTSVFGGAFEPEFAVWSQALFDDFRAGRFVLVTSGIVDDETSDAPEPVRHLFEEMVEIAEAAPLDEFALALRDAYLAAGVVTTTHMTDALHVALATTLGCAVIASWNFKHIVHFQKTPLYNAVNTLNGYAPIAICAPPEVYDHGSETDS